MEIVEYLFISILISGTSSQFLFTYNLVTSIASFKTFVSGSLILTIHYKKYYFYFH